MNYKCPCCQALDNYISGRTSQWYTLIAELMMFELKSVCWDFISFSAEKASGGKCTCGTCVLHRAHGETSTQLSPLFLTVKLLLFPSWVTYIVGSFHLLFFCLRWIYLVYFKSTCLCFCVCIYMYSLCCSGFCNVLSWPKIKHTSYFYKVMSP